MSNAIAATTARDLAAHWPGLIEHIASGESLRDWLAMHGVTVGTFYRFLDANAGAADQYMRARVWRAHWRAETIEATASDVLAGKVKPDAGRVAIDAYKWIAARLDHVTYGEHKHLTATVTHKAGDAAELSNAELAAIARKAGAIDAEATEVA